jgi:hypothetical protein
MEKNTVNEHAIKHNVNNSYCDSQRLGYLKHDLIGSAQSGNKIGCFCLVMDIVKMAE